MCNSCICNCAIFRTWLSWNSKSLLNMSDDQAYSEPWHTQNGLSKHLQWYLGIFKDTDAYSHTHSRATQIKRRGETSPVLFENQKKCPDFGKTSIDWVNLWVKFFIQNIVLKTSRRKNTKMFPCGTLFFLCYWLNFYQSALVLQISFLPWKISGCAPASIHYSLCKMLHLKFLTVLWIYVLLTAQ